MDDPLPRISTNQILAARPEKQPVTPDRPYAFHVEHERSARGMVDPVATIFLTNRECPFRCLMCDLWKHTTDESVPSGAISRQIDYALERLPDACHIKLYNSGNFFDRKAIPAEDYEAIAARVAGFETVIVENHPRLCGPSCRRFGEMISGDLEIALGLETVHPGVLDRLNKQMTLDDFSDAVVKLRSFGVRSRAFILLRPPFMSDAEGIEWALRSIEFAFEHGVEVCSVIPTRAGNGMMERLRDAGHYVPPSMDAIETVLEQGIHLNGGRVFMDLWDLERFYACDQCGPRRKDRLGRMNKTQEIEPPITCTHLS